MEELGDSGYPPSLEKLNGLICGCADDESVWGEILGELERCAASTYVAPEKLVAHVCDWAGLTEHGGGIRGAWLTQDGEKALAFLRKNGVRWIDKK